MTQESKRQLLKMPNYEPLLKLLERSLDELPQELSDVVEPLVASLSSQARERGVGYNESGIVLELLAAIGYLAIISKTESAGTHSITDAPSFTPEAYEALLNAVNNIAQRLEDIDEQDQLAVEAEKASFNEGVAKVSEFNDALIASINTRLDVLVADMSDELGRILEGQHTTFVETIGELRMDVESVATSTAHKSDELGRVISRVANSSASAETKLSQLIETLARIENTEKKLSQLEGQLGDINQQMSQLHNSTIPNLVSSTVESLQEALRNEVHEVYKAGVANAKLLKDVDYDVLPGGASKNKGAGLVIDTTAKKIGAGVAALVLILAALMLILGGGSSTAPSTTTASTQTTTPSTITPQSTAPAPAPAG
jgi:Asp-tRNA(Asn)/Glu-tRNA(Gln) amidotransferase C subunit